MDDKIDIDNAEMIRLERELPVLTRLRRFALSLENFSWFNAIGEAMPAPVRDLADTYLDTLGFPDADIAILVDWDDAAAAAETLDWANPAWETEELTRADFTGKALEFVSEEALQLGLAFVADKASGAAHDGMEEATAIWDTPADEAVRNLAVGSAVQTSHNAALALLAAVIDSDINADHNLFTCKLTLFQAGRWPVGVLGNSFNIF